MDNQGWIKLHRSILDSSPLFGKASDFGIFVYLITLADRRTGVARVGRLKLAKLFRMKQSNVYKVMKRLELGNYINIKSNNQFSEVYICNYDKYQGQSNNESSNKVATKEQQSNTKQEDKKKEVINNPIEEYISKYNQLYKSHSRITTIRRTKYALRLKVFTHEEILFALEEMSKDPWFRGQNDRKWLPEPDFLIRSDENVDRFLNRPKPIEKTTREEVQEWLSSVGADPNSI